MSFLIFRLTTSKASTSLAAKITGVLILMAGLVINFMWLSELATSTQKHITSDATERTASSTEESSGETPNSSEQSASLYKITRVVDGDTVKADIDGEIKTIRLIGVDTPETVDPRQPVQCFGQEASNYTRDKLAGKTVRLESDPSQGDTDKYGRLLRYIFISDANFNLSLITEGYAFEYTYRLPYKYQAEFKTAQKQAAKDSRGLWAENTCGGVLNLSTQISNQTVAPSADCKIKGNISSKGDKIYHMPGQRYYEQTVISESAGEKWFCDEDEAKKAGWRKSKV